MKPKIGNARKNTIPEAKIFWKNVDYLKATHGLTDNDIAFALKRSVSTIYNHKANPENTDLRDLYNAALYFDIEPAARLLLPIGNVESNPSYKNARKTTFPEAKIFWKNVDYLKSIHGLTDNDVARALIRNVSTIYNRKAEPENTDFRDLYNAALFFGIKSPAQLLIPMTVGDIVEIPLYSSAETA